jgi:indole-3-glycerol phosphate synthase
LEDLRRVAARVDVPVLRKDFILDETQIAEARAMGASAVLLIVRALTPVRLRQLAAAAADWRLDVLVEAHDASEVESAVQSGARFIGINARNLDSFTLDTEQAWKLFAMVPHDRIAVAESGMSSAEDVERAAAAGADAVLIGTALSASPDPAALVRQCASVSRRGR